MQVHIIALGTKMPAWVKEGCQEYKTRLTAHFPVTVTEIPLVKRSKNLSDKELNKIKDLEGQKLLTALSSKSLTVALEVTGKSMSTELFAKQLDALQHKTATLNFLIGGPDGLSPNCLSKADFAWSLSPLTLPHPLVRIILLEQLYRASSLLKNHPYHRA